MQDSVTQGRRRRDPAARRSAMVEAAVELITERGSAALTHRAVAARANVALGTTTSYFHSIDELRETALRTIADRIDAAIATMDHQLAREEVTADRLATLLLGFLTDDVQARESIILAHAALSDPRLRDLSSRAARRLIEILTRYVGAARAVALQVFLDGATLSSTARGITVDRGEITRVIAAILAMPGDRD